MSLDQQVAALQKEVAGLQSQVNALLAVVQAINSGVAGQRPNVLISGTLIPPQRNEHDGTHGGLALRREQRRCGPQRLDDSPERRHQPIATAGSPVQVQGNGGA